jgi:hypothetical protein
MHAAQDKAVEDAMRALDMLEGMLQWLLRSSSSAGGGAEPGSSTAQPADSLPDAAALEDPGADAESSPEVRYCSPDDYRSWMASLMT